MYRLTLAIMFVFLQINTCKMIDYERILKTTVKPLKLETPLKFYPQRVSSFKTSSIQLKPYNTSETYDILKAFKTLGTFNVLYPRTVNRFRNLMSDREVLAMTLWTEARGEGYKGIKAVASVIVNRLKSSQFKMMRTYRGVCLQRFQFSAWNYGVTPVLDIANDRDYNIWCYCLMVADDMLKGVFVPMISSTHYYAFKKCKPSWSNMRKVVYIGNHKFGVV